ncbi:hypothetical protein F5X68DRAFT_243195 [Plectosphaerella plurivora]|uniref:Uncharacterized protein n=1 Tax=Plectosphaerella plurivora TaxID=936078 RepID=A0A9P8V744_9PEZI|nr:hypothetical protein F5X68DRAFT_243195 [Plectosphaerella plurivora]
MSDTSDSRIERSMNRFYPTLGEAHRNITSRSADASRQAFDQSTGGNADQVSPMSSEDGHQEMQPPNPTSVYNGQDSHQDRASFAPQGGRPSYQQHNAALSLPALAYNPNATPRSPPDNVLRRSQLSNYRSPYSEPYEQETPYTNYEVFSKDTEDSQLQDLERGNINDDSMNDAADDISWNMDNTQYRFLHKNSERNLSRVLGETSRISNPVFEIEGNQSSLDRGNQFSLNRGNSIVDYRIRHDGRASNAQQRRPNQFYNDAAIHSGMQIDQNGVRVPTSPPPGRNSPDPDESADATGPTPWSQLSDEQFSRIPLDNLASVQALRNTQDNNQGPEDWETVDDEHRASWQRASGNPHQNSAIGRVINGSSIADYSDRLVPEDAHNLDDPTSTSQLGWWERPARRMPPVPPRGSSRNIQRNDSNYQQTQNPRSAYRPYGFQQAPTRGVSALEARSALYSRHEQSSEQDGPSYELSNMEYGQEIPIRPPPIEINRNPFRWTRVNAEVQAHQDQLDAEREANEPPQIGRPLSGFDHVKLPCGLISLQDAFIIQKERRASGLEDQSESGNYIAHHPMINTSPSTGLMVQPVLPTQERPLYQRAGGPMIRPPSAVRTSTIRAPFPSTSIRGPTLAPQPQSIRTPALTRTYNAYDSRSRGYTTYSDNNGRNPFMTPSEHQNEQDQNDFQSVDLRRPQPAYLGNGVYSGNHVQSSHGSRGGSFGGDHSDSEADLWRASINPRDRNPCRRRDPLTPRGRRTLDGIFHAMLVINLVLPVAAAVTHTRHFADALSWTTRGEICHLRS